MASVVPLNVDTPRSPGPTVFEIVESRPLPTIDLSRSIRSECCGPGLRRVWERFLRQGRTPLTLSCIGALFVGFVSLFVDSAIGRALSVISSIVYSVGTLAHFSLFRWDLIALLMSTYEFWFFSLVNTGSCLLLGRYLSGGRGILAMPIWFGFQNNILTDSNIAMDRVLFPLAMAAISFSTTLIACITLGVLKDVEPFVLVRLSPDRYLAAEDVMVNGLLIQIVILVRTLYRRRAVLKLRGSSASMIHCMMYRACVQLRPVQLSGVPPVASESDSRSSSLAPTNRVQLRLRRALERFDESRILLPSVTRFLGIGATSPALWVRMSSWLTAAMGISGTVVASILKAGSPQGLLGIVAVVTSLVFCGSSLATSQPRLLRHLVQSFDFAFVSVQLTLQHLCLCDMLAWDARCWCLLSSWTWIHWVLTLDAMCPSVKRAWGLGHRVVAPILAAFLAGHLYATYCVTFDADGGNTRNRIVLAATIGARTLEMRVLPLLLSRNVVIVGWSLRMLWRLLTRADHELILIQGGVMYLNNRRQRKRELPGPPS